MLVASAWSAGALLVGIRPPHRLVHSGVTKDAKCPYCSEEKCDAAHIFWDCEGMNAKRQRYVEQISAILKSPYVCEEIN